MVLPLLAAIAGGKHEINLLDNAELFYKSNRILGQIQRFKPDIAGFSIIAGRDIFNTIRVIKQVRRRYPKLILLAGGQAGTFFSSELLDNGVNFVVRGEGEVTLKELIKSITQRVSDYSSIRGISYKAEGAVLNTPERPMINNLDDSPFPLADLMPRRKSTWFPGRFTGSIETSRGCPFDCNFCAITSFWKRSFRTKSNERIIDEIKYLAQRGRTHLYLADDNFGMDTEKHIELFERILNERLDVRFFAQMRTDTIAQHPEMVALAAKAGLYGALIGFDAYDSETFHHISKAGSIEMNIKCSEVMRKYKIMIFGSHIYGLPSQKKPLDFAKTFWVGRRNSDLFRMSYFSLLPGTKYYGKQICQEEIDSKAGNDDYRLLIRNKKEQRLFKRWYQILNLLNIFLPDELLMAIMHPNRNVRKIKQYGYIGIFRHYLYRFLRTVKLCNI